MVTRLSDYIKTYDDKLDKSFCETIINTFHESDSIYVDREQRPTFRELNISERYLNKDPKWMSIQARLSDILTVSAKSYINYLDVGVDFPAQYGFEQFRMKMYDNNGKDQFKDHVDVGDYASAKRFLVMFLYLSNNAKGETIFLRQNAEGWGPKVSSCHRGNMLIFPSLWPWLHRGNFPVTSPKYIVGSYLHYVD